MRNACASFNEATLDCPIIYMPQLSRVSSRRKVCVSTLCASAALIVVVVLGISWMDAAMVTDMTNRAQMPSFTQPFGTDMLGRDMLQRTVAGLAQSVLIGLLAAGASACIALGLGLIAALGGCKADACVTWIIDLMMGIPHIVLLILISYALGKGFVGVVVGIALTHWPSLARVVRAEVLQIKQAPYVAMAQKLGVNPLKIAWKHIIPHVLPQFLVGAILLFPHAVLHEAAVTFLGFGLSPESAAIGIILSESMGYLSAGMWWLAVFPGVVLIGVVMMFDVVGQGLRKLIDPAHAQE